MNRIRSKKMDGKFGKEKELRLSPSSVVIDSQNACDFLSDLTISTNDGIQINQSMCKKKPGDTSPANSNFSQSNAEGSASAATVDKSQVNVTTGKSEEEAIGKTKQGGKENSENTENNQFERSLNLDDQANDDAFKKMCDEEGPMPTFVLRKPGASKYKYRKEKKPKPLKYKDMIPLGSRRNELMEDHPSHLPFYKHSHYDRIKIIRRVSKVPEMQGFLNQGMYYVEKDFNYDVDPRLPTEEAEKLHLQIENKKKSLRFGGRYNRIAALFFAKILNWIPLSDMTIKTNKQSVLSVFYLGRNLARTTVMKVCAPPPPKPIFKFQPVSHDKKTLILVNRLPNDVIFQDKEVFCQSMRTYMHRMGLTCSELACAENPEVTNKMCAHQSLTMSSKPCLIEECFNCSLPLCPHLVTFVPETISFSSYSGLLTFTERLSSQNDLGGTVFLLKPAYLANGRGIRFLTKVDQFRDFYHMADGTTTCRHGVCVQRYIENPLVFRGRKFSLKFFLQICVLNKRRVIAFIHPGVVIVAKESYTKIERDDDVEEDVDNWNNEEKDEKFVGLGRVTTEEFDPFVHITNYVDPEVRKARKAAIKEGTAKRLEKEDDNVYYTTYVIDPQSESGHAIYDQMKFVGQCVLEYLEPTISGYCGAYQLVAIDAIIDTRLKLWVTEFNNKIFSGLTSIAPRQRQIMSGILQEALGITCEVFYKMHNDLPLFYDYSTRKDDLKTGFYFAQDFEYFYETDFTKTDDYLMVQPDRKPTLPLEESFIMVDDQKIAAAKRRSDNFVKVQNAISTRSERRAKINAKKEEES